MTAEEFRALALALPGTAEAPHVDRAAFKVKRIYATLSKAGDSVNLNLSPEEQAHYSHMLPQVFAPVPNAWGTRGWTRAILQGADAQALTGALRAAWHRAG